ncbi:sulfatase-like hydrolase/transferase [Pseudomonas sp. R2.Fl]|nr:sulfatase-like hydrolase/transferase [Pseudomonas sp. R2.Fl]
MAEGITRFGWLRSALADLLVWYLLPAAFLYLYIENYGASRASIFPHSMLLLSATIGLASLRLLSWRFLPCRLARIAVAVLQTIPAILLPAYYALVLIGLSSWGRVISWPLIHTYASQGLELANTLGFSPTVVAISISCTLLIPPIIIWKWIAPYDWLRQAGHLNIAKPTYRLIAIILFSASFSALWLMKFTLFLPSKVEEPFNLTFLPTKGLQKLQHHVLGTVSVLDKREDSARKQYETNPRFRPINIVLIVSDALRADRLGLYGYPRATTPFLSHAADRQDLVLLKDARSICAESSCGLMALSTSRYATDFPSRPFSLQEVLRRHGYQVHMMLGGDHTNFYGLREAYGEVDSYIDGSTQSTYYMNDDRLVLDAATRLKYFDGNPVMMQFHLMSSHALGLRFSASSPFEPSANYYKWAARPPSYRASKSEVELASNYYDKGVLQFDTVLDQLLDTLGKKGYLDSALVVITADHGEMLAEHGEFSHSKQVFEGALHIPLILMRHGYNGERIDLRRFASQIDIAPTILEDLAIPIPSSWKGIPLQKTHLSSRSIIRFQQRELAGLYDLSDPKRIIKYWRNLNTGQEFVFDLSKDSGELVNLVGQPWPSLAKWRTAVLPGSFVAPVEDDNPLPPVMPAPSERPTTIGGH